MSKTTINGIDVSGCPLYDKNTGCYHTFNGECVKDSCTVYKWLLEYKRLQKENEEWAKKHDKLKETLKSVRGYFVVLENIIPIEMLSEGSGVFGAINDAKKEINEVLNDRD